MPNRFLSMALLGALLSAEAAASDHTIELDRDAVIALAEQRATSLLLARSRLSGAEAEVALARRWRHGPNVEVDAGHRFEGEETWDRGVAIRQRLDLRRGSRIARAVAEREAMAADVEAVRAAVAAAAMGRYFDALYAQERQVVAKQAVALHERLQETAQSRFDAGDIGELDLNLARIALGRSRSAFARAEAERTAALAALRRELALPIDGRLQLTGELSWSLPSDHGALAWDPRRHPRLRSLRAAVQQAESGIAAARAQARPELELVAGYEHEEGVDIARIGVGVAFGAPGRGEAAATIAAAEVRSRRLELERTELRLRTEIGAGWQRYQDLRRSYETYTVESMAGVDDNVELAEHSYRAGNIPLGDLLSIRRELLDAQIEVLDLRRAVAEAALDTALAAGLPPFTPAVGQPGADPSIDHAEEHP